MPGPLMPRILTNQADWGRFSSLRDHRSSQIPWRSSRRRAAPRPGAGASAPSFKEHGMTTTIRRHDIDALRALAFLLLILYHVGMYYVAGWPWHLKSPHAAE